MSSTDGLSAADPTLPGGLTAADRAFLLALDAWGEREDFSRTQGRSAGQSSPESSLLQRWLEPDWARRLRDALETRQGMEARSDPAAALAQLRRARQAEARVDPSRIHPSWFIRALQDESPSVRRLIAAHGPEPLTRAVPAAWGLSPDDLAADRPPVPEVLNWVLALWTERLVGGEPDPARDPLVIVALGGVSARATYRLCQIAGLAKLALAGDADPARRPPPLEAERLHWLRDRLGAADPRVEAWAGRDVRAGADAGALRGAPRRRQAAALGLTTIARLLAECEPFRVRWALQHLPYPIAKRIRSLMPPSHKQSAAVAQLERLLLQTAWERLNLEGRTARAGHGEAPDEWGTMQVGI